MTFVYVYRITSVGPGLHFHPGPRLIFVPEQKGCLNAMKKVGNTLPLGISILSGMAYF